MSKSLSFIENISKQFRSNLLGLGALYLVFVFAFIGIYAPFFASSKPLLVIYDGQWYFPLFRYLFFQGFFTKKVDLFYNLLMVVLPFSYFFIRGKRALFLGAILQLILFIFLLWLQPQDPASDPRLNSARQRFIKEQQRALSWKEKLGYMSPYEKLNRVLRHYQRARQDELLQRYAPQGKILPTLWQNEREALEQQLKSASDQRKHYLQEKDQWLKDQEAKLSMVWMPLWSHFHWEDDAGGQQALNQQLPFWLLTRINQKDLTAALIFGIRISLMVGVLAVGIQLLIGIPIGSIAGFWAGKVDIVISRLLEIWEGLPTFFMLLMVVAILQSKSIFLVLTVLGVFGWTGISRFIRAEVLKQRNLPYVEALKCSGFPSLYILFTHVLPNAIPPILTLLPFAIMGAISSEAGLSFLGLGEEGSCSWGVLMDEGRLAFPGESYLLWPPAILLTLLLIAIALIGDALRDAMDPKMHRS